MKKNKKIFFNSVLVTVFLIFFSFYSYKVLGFFKIVNNDNIKSAAYLAEEVNSDNIDITKDNQDLLNVDYQKYYDDLKPYGTWIKINLSDYVTDKNKPKDKKEISDVIRELLGVSDAKADFNFGWGIFYVWKPFPTMAVTLVAGEPSPEYIPYTNGRWVYSDYGWYFRGATYQEEIVHHYGRWIFVPGEGWIWVPGSRWAPSWVNWEENDDYISWTPSTPCFYHYNDYYAVPSYWQNNCVVVERRHFLDPDVYRYSHQYRRQWDWYEDRDEDRDEGRHEGRHEFRDMKRIHGPEYRNQMVYNDGPDFNNFENNYGRKIDPVNINLVSNREDVRYDKKQYDVYSYGAGKKEFQNNDNGNIFQKFSGNKFTTNNNFDSNNKKSGKNNSSLTNNNSRDYTYQDRNNDYSKNKEIIANNLKQKQEKGNNNNKFSNNLNTRENTKGITESNIKKNNKVNNKDNKNVNIGNDNNNRKKDITSKNIDKGFNNSKNKVKNNDQVKPENNNGKRNNTFSKNIDNGFNNNSGNKIKNNDRVKSDNNSGKRNNTFNKNNDNGFNNNSGNKMKKNDRVKSDNNSGIRNNTSNKTRNNDNKFNQGNKTNNNERGNVGNKNQKKDFSSQPNQNQRNDVRPNNKVSKSEKNNSGNNNGKRQYVDDTKMSPHDKNNYVPPSNNKGNNTSADKNNGKRSKK